MQCGALTSYIAEAYFGHKNVFISGNFLTDMLLNTSKLIFYEPKVLTFMTECQNMSSLLNMEANPNIENSVLSSMICGMYISHVNGSTL